MAAVETPHARLGSRIRAARKRAGLSHDRLGAMVGTSRQHLIRLEKGIHKPKAALLERIAEATGQPPKFFASDDEDEEPHPVSLDEALRLTIRQQLREILREKASGPREEVSA